MRLHKNEAIYLYLKDALPELLEDDVMDATSAVLSIPQKAPEGAVTRGESAIEFLDRVSDVYRRWVKPGHVVGANHNNVSATVSVRRDEWDAVGAWMWANRLEYTGLSVLPFSDSDHTYVQAPFEDCDQATYERLRAHLERVDLRNVLEAEDETDLLGELACGPDGCTVTYA
jgi:ribonucleoside-triphosphate reductase (thioredoxin)